LLPIYAIAVIYIVSVAAVFEDVSVYLKASAIGNMTELVAFFSCVFISECSEKPMIMKWYLPVLLRPFYLKGLHALISLSNFAGHECSSFCV